MMSTPVTPTHNGFGKNLLSFNDSLGLFSYAMTNDRQALFRWCRAGVTGQCRPPAKAYGKLWWRYGMRAVDDAWLRQPPLARLCPGIWKLSPSQSSCAESWRETVFYWRITPSGWRRPTIAVRSDVTLKICERMRRIHQAGERKNFVIGVVFRHCSEFSEHWLWQALRGEKWCCASRSIVETRRSKNSCWKWRNEQWWPIFGNGPSLRQGTYIGNRRRKPDLTELSAANLFRTFVHRTFQSCNRWLLPSGIELSPLPGPTSYAFIMVTTLAIDAGVKIVTNVTWRAKVWLSFWLPCETLKSNRRLLYIRTADDAWSSVRNANDNLFLNEDIM